MARSRITVQQASSMPRCIMLQVRDGQGLNPQFPGLTDGQFPYMAPQTQAPSVSLPNRRFTKSNAFSMAIPALRQYLGAAHRRSLPATVPPEMHHLTRKSP